MMKRGIGDHQLTILGIKSIDLQWSVERKTHSVRITFNANCKFYGLIEFSEFKRLVQTELSVFSVERTLLVPKNKIVTGEEQRRENK